MDIGWYSFPAHTGNVSIINIKHWAECVSVQGKLFLRPCQILVRTRSPPQRVHIKPPLSPWRANRVDDMSENILELRIKSGHVLIDWAESQIGESGEGREEESRYRTLYSP